MITTIQALVAIAVGVLPGALYLFAWEAGAGAYGAKVSDRIFRFVGASAFFHAAGAGLTYAWYRRWATTGGLQHGKVEPWVIEILAILYVGVPYGVGRLAAFGYKKDWRGFRNVLGRNREPVAWEYVWQHERAALVRLRLKSGGWLGGLYGQLPGSGPRSYASAYPDDSDIFLADRIELDHDTGEIVADQSGAPTVLRGQGVLVRWDEIEFLEYITNEGANS